jgi:hypothetical protein
VLLRSSVIGLVRVVARARRGLAPAALLLGAAACGPGVAPTPVPRPAPPIEAAPVPMAPVASHLAIPSLVTDTRYRLETRTQLEVDSAGRRVTQTITSRAQAVVRQRRQADGALTASGKIFDYVVASGLLATPPKLDSLRFDAELDAQALRVALQPPLANECDRPETGALSLVREVLVRVPASVAIGDTWRDSTVQIVCRASVPMIVRTNATYTVLDSARSSDGTLVVIRRTSTTRLEGKTTSPWRALDVTGTGTATLEFRVAVLTGAVRRLEGTSTLTLTVTDKTSPTSLRAQQVTQLVSLTGTAISP